MDESGPTVGLVPSEVTAEVHRLRERRIWLALNQARSTRRTTELRRRAQAVRAALTALSED